MSCKPTWKCLVALGAVMLFAATSANAKCKFQTDMVSIATGEHVRWTNWSLFSLAITTNPYAIVTGISEGDRKYVGLRVHMKTDFPRRPTTEDLDNAISVPAGAKVQFLMADDSIVGLQTEEPVVGDSDFIFHHATKYEIVTEAIIKARASAAELDVLTGQRVKQIRIATTNEDIDLTFGKKGSKKMQEVLECIQ